MKVRCIDDCDIDIGQITNGKVYDVLKEGGLGYLIIDDLNIRKYLRKDRFEIVKEENKMEKTFREVIADIKEGEVWESVQDCFQLSEITCFEGRIRFRLKNVFVDIVDGNNNVDTGAGGGQTFKLQRKEYTFTEAFKAYEEGKEIESCENGYKYLQNTFTYPGNEQWLCFRNSEQMFTTDAIRGKWYIND